MEKIETTRLTVAPTSESELEALAAALSSNAPELSRAYLEMLSGIRLHPGQFLWYTPWKLCLKDSGEVIGYAGFKGIYGGNRTELGYGIDAEYRGSGYATEAVGALCRFAFSSGVIMFIDAEAEPENLASQRVLIKNGFLPTGQTGDEGIRYVLEKH